MIAAKPLSEKFCRLLKDFAYQTDDCTTASTRQRAQGGGGSDARSACQERQERSGTSYNDALSCTDMRPEMQSFPCCSHSLRVQKRLCRMESRRTELPVVELSARFPLDWPPPQRLKESAHEACALTVPYQA